jgi:hypothetical protein
LSCRCMLMSSCSALLAWPVPNAAAAAAGCGTPGICGQPGGIRDCLHAMSLLLLLLLLLTAAAGSGTPGVCGQPAATDTACMPCPCCCCCSWLLLQVAERQESVVNQLQPTLHACPVPAAAAAHGCCCR